MAVMTSPPCSWPVSYTECGPCEAYQTADGTGDGAQETQDIFESMAVSFLWNWTGRMLGTCPATIRPSVGCEQPSTWNGHGPYALYGVPLLCGQHPYTECGCISALNLRALYIPGNVSVITSVKLDGVEMDKDDWRFNGSNVLYRTDGESWPVEQDLSKNDTENGTWSISYDDGNEVPVGGQIAAGILACELAKGACKDSTCRLPQRIQTITRQGVSMTMMDSFEDISKGHTGIWLIDSWVASITKSPRGASVINPDKWAANKSGARPRFVR